MRLSAIYLPNLSLPYIFGKEHEGITLNFGGRYKYKFVYKNEKISLIEKTDNESFIERFWNDKVSLVSAIVGANGSGKTTILRKFIVDELAVNSENRGCVFIYENETSTYLLNETQINIEDSDEFELIDPNKKQNVLNEKILYYSPNLDYDLQDLSSPISLVDYHKNDLAVYYLGSLKRHLFFLNNKELITSLKSNYKDFPFYEELEFKAKALYKNDFEKIYIQSTLGNKLFRIRNRLLRIAQENGRFGGENSITLNKEEIENIFDRDETIQDELKALWEVYENKNPKKSQYLHDSSNFFKDVEVNLLSYLVINDHFPQDGDTGSYPFNHVLESKTFEERLTHFLRKYILQQSKMIYEIVRSTDCEITVINIKTIKEKVNELSNSKISFRKVDFENKTKRVIKSIELIENVYKFYEILNWFSKDFRAKIYGSGFTIKINETDLDKFSEFIDIYESLLSKIKDGNLNAVLDISSTKTLSTGEKSLIDMYASIYDYLKRYGDMKHIYSENYILLLDEPEQGYHPIWKKKFVQSITSTLKPLFEINDKAKSIQVIFTTHDPLTLSDIPKSNIIYLQKNIDEETTSIVSSDKKHSFGANIHELLADSFFIENGLIGDFVKSKIEEVIEWINKNKDKEERGENYEIELENNKRIISFIDEPILKSKLSEMIGELVGDKEFIKHMLQKEIDHLTRKRDRL